MENIQELWQLEANGKIFETNLSEISTWIGEGAVLRQDKVRKGNLRWIEAGKVPSLMAFFNAFDNGQPIPPVVTTTDPGSTVLSQSEPASTTSQTDTLIQSAGDFNDAVAFVSTNTSATCVLILFAKRVRILMVGTSRSARFAGQCAVLYRR